MSSLSVFFRILKVKNIFQIFFIASFIASSLASEPASLSKDDEWLLNEALKVNNIYKTPYENEPWMKISKVIDGKTYVVNRNNHGLAHAMRKAFLIRKIIELLSAHPEGKVALWLQQKLKSDKDLLKKLELAALYHRAGRENENSRSDESEAIRNRFDKNMRNGADMLRKAAKETGIFKDDAEIENYALPFSRYELQEKKIPLTGDAVFVDKILYATHILDSQRVNADWNDLSKNPDEKEKRKTKITDSLGYLTPAGSRPSATTIKIGQELSDLASRLLKVTQDRDKFENRTTYGTEFYLQAHDPKRMIEKIGEEYRKK